MQKGFLKGGTQVQEQVEGLSVSSWMLQLVAENLKEQNTW